MNDLSHIRHQLLTWFDRTKRDLPWRKTKDPYAIWISEMMLQQTQVDTVLPYYKRWMSRYPSIKDLQEASLEPLLKLWEGLGYYSRVRNIHKTAKQIGEKFGSIFPDNEEDLLSLPGIGKYTSGAILSIAFNQRKPVVDGNVQRVLSRIYHIDRDIKLPEIQKKLWTLAEELLPKKRPGDFNEAMMELGALICRPRNPQCIQCPLQSHCEAFKKNCMDQLPVKTQKVKIQKIQTVIALITHQDKIYIQKRPPEGFLGGLWEFPGGKIEKGETPEEALRREIREELGTDLCIGEKRKTVTHSYTRFRVTLHPFECTLPKPKQILPTASQHLWVRISELSHYAFPAANKKIIEEIRKRSHEL